MAYDTMTLRGTKYVLIPEAEYKAMAKGVPPLPATDGEGNMPALAFADAAIARTIVRRREAVGLTQRDLAAAAGIRVEVLNRAERGVTVPSVRTLTKIEHALVAAQKKAKAPRR
jgi:DNA-binding XRE family transcriptional regulator